VNSLAADVDQFGPNRINNLGVVPLWIIFAHRF